MNKPIRVQRNWGREAGTIIYQRPIPYRGAQGLPFYVPADVVKEAA